MHLRLCLQLREQLLSLRHQLPRSLEEAHNLQHALRVFNAHVERARRRLYATAESAPDGHGERRVTSAIELDADAPPRTRT